MCIYIHIYKYAYIFLCMYVYTCTHTSTQWLSESHVERKPRSRLPPASEALFFPAACRTHTVAGVCTARHAVQNSNFNTLSPHTDMFTPTFRNLLHHPLISPLPSGTRRVCFIPITAHAGRVMSRSTAYAFLRPAAALSTLSFMGSSSVYSFWASRGSRTASKSSVVQERRNRV